MQLLIFIVLPCFVLSNGIGSTEDEIMDHLNSDITEHKVMLYSKTYCRWSRKIKSLLHEYDIKDIKVVEVNLQPHTRDIQRCLYHISGSRTVPQLFINGSFIGGFTDTKELEDNGEFRKILEEAGAI